MKLPCSAAPTFNVLLALAVALTASAPIRATDWTALHGADAAATRALLQTGVDIKSRDADGNPALLVAALQAGAGAVQVLLEAGADANATNQAGASALIYGAADPRKVRLLLGHGADPNHASAQGNTPLLAASGAPRSEQSVALLLAAGANLRATNATGLDALGRAAFAGNTEVVRLLLRHGADPNTRPMQPNIEGNIEPASAPLHNAGFRGEPKMIEALLRAGADVNAVEPFAGSALHNALYGNHPAAAAVLIRHGVNLELRTAIGDVPALVWSAYSDTGDTTVARLLLERKVAPDSKNEAGETALTWARKRGDNDLVPFLADRGVADPKVPKQKPIPENPVAAPGTEAWNGAIRDSIQRSVALLEITSSAFLDSRLAQRNNCVSCHQHTLPAVAFGAARERGFAIDEATLKKQFEAQVRSWSGRIPNAYELEEPQPDAPVNLGIGLMGLAALGHKADALTDAMTWYLAAIQEKDGSWRSDDFRPPLEDGRIPAAALALHSLQLYPIRGRETEFKTRVDRAAAWLARAEPKTPNQLHYKLLGLAWSGSQPVEQQRAARRVLRSQRPDGGWAQLPGLESDAWATGQALVALRQSDALTLNDPVYQRGVAFLLRTQFPDGSWFVRSRTWPFQPFFNSQFPHGKDQWISAAGSTWATIALLNTIPGGPRLALR
jgi:ankyrin repeat protein